MQLTVILSTYNEPERLAMTLTGYEGQTHRGFDLVIADDGSTSETADLIAEFRDRGRLDIDHVWHEDEGFRKCEILNRGIQAAAGDYLLISDGDCIPHPEFLEVHARLARPGRFLSGGRCMLTRELTESLTREDITSGRLFDASWRESRGGLARPRDRMKLARRDIGVLLDRLTPTKATWNGHNASGWKSDIVGVNGFDERFGYGGLDRELGERLMNAGVRALQIRHRAVVFHLDHERGYVDPEIVKRNTDLRRTVTRGQRMRWTEHGIVKQGSAKPSD